MCKEGPGLRYPQSLTLSGCSGFAPPSCTGTLGRSLAACTALLHVMACMTSCCTMEAAGTAHTIPTTKYLH